MDEKVKYGKHGIATATILIPNGTNATEHKTILAFRAIDRLQSLTFLGSNWGNLVLEAIAAVLNLKVAVVRAIVPVSD